MLKKKKKKKISLKINKLFDYWNIFWILRNSGIFIFFKKITQNSINDLYLSLYFNDKLNYFVKNLKKKIMVKFINKKINKIVVNYNNILLVPSFEDIFNILKIIKNHNLQVLGYFYNNIFFHKKDLDLININQNKISIFTIVNINLNNIINLKNKLNIILKMLLYKINLIINK